VQERGKRVCLQVHLILRHKSPVTGKIEEKHLKGAPSIKTDKATAVYTAILRPDNTCALTRLLRTTAQPKILMMRLCWFRFSVLIDGAEVKSGELHKDFEPAFNPPKEIPDPEDSKPDDWVDAAK
jgi:hypothetical protein